VNWNRQQQGDGWGVGGCKSKYYDCPFKGIKGVVKEQCTENWGITPILWISMDVRINAVEGRKEREP
jgi:hypothetical protein